jgi:hypothetical protein
MLNDGRFGYNRASAASSAKSGVHNIDEEVGGATAMPQA